MIPIHTHSLLEPSNIIIVVGFNSEGKCISTSEIEIESRLIKEFGKIADSQLEIEKMNNELDAVLHPLGNERMAGAHDASPQKGNGPLHDPDTSNDKLSGHSVACTVKP